MKTGKNLLLAIVLAMILSCSVCAYAESAITALKTEGLTAPLGVDTSSPAFSWQMQSDEIGAAQKSYQILVRDASDTVIWDSGNVEDSSSVDILYAGEALKPASVYSWQVIVLDQNGRTLTSDRAFFETSLMSDSRQAWQGAEWIGAGLLPLDAPSKSTFHISADVQLQEGTDKVSFILGADDYRLKNSAFNCLLLDGENYVRVELDFSAASDEGGVCVNVYRCGYGGDADANTPFYTSKASESLDAVLTRINQYDVHHFDIFCNDSDLTFTIDGVELTGDAAHVNPTDNLNTFPNMSCVGFAMNAGESAVISNYTLSNGGRYARGTLLDQNTGATTRIFSGLDGIMVNGNTITVNGGEQGILVYADPSWGAAPMLRTDFSLQEAAVSARLYVSVKGICNFYINGQEVGADDWFNPGAAQYDAILPYSIYDVTDLLNTGENAMGAVLGEGWWTGMMTFEPLNNNYYGDEPALMAMLTVTYADGSSQTIVTDCLE